MLHLDKPRNSAIKTQCLVCKMGDIFGSNLYDFKLGFSEPIAGESNVYEIDSFIPFFILKYSPQISFPVLFSFFSMQSGLNKYRIA